MPGRYKNPAPSSFTLLLSHSVLRGDVPRGALGLKKKSIRVYFALKEGLVVGLATKPGGVERGWVRGGREKPSKGGGSQCQRQNKSQRHWTGNKHGGNFTG